MFGADTPVDGLNFSLFVSPQMMYVPESEKNDSSAVTRFRRSDFIAAVYAFVFVLANFGIAIAARMPMITTTISSSMSVKPFFRVVFIGLFPCWRMQPKEGTAGGRVRSWWGVTTAH